MHLWLSTSVFSFTRHFMHPTIHHYSCHITRFYHFIDLITNLVEYPIGYYHRYFFLSLVVVTLDACSRMLYVLCNTVKPGKREEPVLSGFWIFKNTYMKFCSINVMFLMICNITRRTILMNEKVKTISCHFTRLKASCTIVSLYCLN